MVSPITARNDDDDDDDDEDDDDDDDYVSTSEKQNRLNQDRTDFLIIFYFKLPVSYALNVHVRAFKLC